MKNKYVAALLAFMLGGIGIHKFYLGRWGWGLIYMLFCITFVPMLVSIVEGLIYLFESKTSFDRQFNGA